MRALSTMSNKLEVLKSVPVNQLPERSWTTSPATVTKSFRYAVPARMYAAERIYFGTTTPLILYCLEHSKQ